MKARIKPRAPVLELSDVQRAEDRARRFERATGCTAVMMRVYTGHHPRLKTPARPKPGVTPP